MGLLQTQDRLHQSQLMSQRVHDTDIQQSALPDWTVSEPQNRVDNCRRSNCRSRPPLTDDHRRTGRVKGPARRPGRIEGSSHPPASERSGPTIPSHGYHSCSPCGPLIETNGLQPFPAVSQMTTILGRSTKVHTVIEYQYHLGSCAQLWTLPSLVVFRYPIADSGFDPD